MTTLPPEGNENPGSQPGQIPDAPAAPPTPDVSGAPAAPPAPGYTAPQQPSYPQQTPPAPGYGAPQQPGYPQQGYPQQGVPPQGYAQPGYQQGAPAGDPAANLSLNYWLSAFFAWIPALIFFIVDKDKGDQRLHALNASNLNFALLRTGVMIVGWIIMGIPVLGWILAVAANITGFVLHVMAASKVKEAYAAGQSDPFKFNIPLVK